MEWREEGTVLRRRTHGERAVILDVLTAARGRHAGVVPGGAGGRRAALLQPGARLMLHWRARLDDQIGTFTIEPLASRAALLGDAARGEAWLTTERQADAARRALGHVGAAQTLPDDLAGYELEEALRALAEITGQDVQEDVVDAVFRNFCVGK